MLQVACHVWTPVAHSMPSNILLHVYVAMQLSNRTPKMQSAGRQTVSLLLIAINCVLKQIVGS